MSSSFSGDGVGAQKADVCVDDGTGGTKCKFCVAFKVLQCTTCPVLLTGILTFSFAGLKSGDLDFSTHTYTCGACSRRRALETESILGSASSEKARADNNNDKQSCVAKDYPCRGENMVYICHYSAYRGYQSLCVREDKTHEIFSAYHDDYCGPCVGGFTLPDTFVREQQEQL